MEKTLIGWAEESLAPDKKVSLAGQFYERISDHVETEITATAIATNPFELFLDYGNYMKARSKAHQTFVMQLTYSAYISSGTVGHKGGDLPTRRTVTEINKMFE